MLRSRITRRGAMDRQTYVEAYFALMEAGELLLSLIHI